MKVKKSLQKLTDSESEIKINTVLNLEEITLKDLATLNEIERNRLMGLINEKFSKAKGTEKDNLIKQLDQIMNSTMKNQLWEYNQNQITWAISTFIQENGRIPTTTEIATKTELSRQTVHKHLKEYSSHPLYLEQIEQFKFLTSKVLARVFTFAVNGDIGAAKLYLNVMGCLNNGQSSNNTLIQNQNNYIQINGTVLSQETIKNLSPEQLSNIETILKAASTKVEILNDDIAD